MTPVIIQLQMSTWSFLQHFCMWDALPFLWDYHREKPLIRKIEDYNEISLLLIPLSGQKWGEVRIHNSKQGEGLLMLGKLAAEKSFPLIISKSLRMFYHIFQIFRLITFIVCYFFFGLCAMVFDILFQWNPGLFHILFVVSMALSNQIIKSWWTHRLVHWWPMLK